MIPAMPDASVLEIGCGRGHTLIALKQRGLAREVTGIELVALPRASRESAHIDRYIVANVETDELDLCAETFDVIVCGDVLEHLNDPWAVVARLKGWLKRGGVLVASVPNVREARTLYNLLLRGDFAYRESGVLDRTHLRFFCKRNILSMLQIGGGTIERIATDIDTKTNWRALLNRITFGLLEEFLVTQYLVVVRKAPAG
ncbi:MAG: class I SAM-dependent methyltransferase [Proteobacteria bacterium]|nr:class I SAM-dependent methyltransferase [Pseudomonadota bacterium]